MNNEQFSRKMEDLVKLASELRRDVNIELKSSDVGYIKKSFRHFLSNIEDIKNSAKESYDFMKSRGLSVNQIEIEGYIRACLDILELSEKYECDFSEEK